MTAGLAVAALLVVLYGAVAVRLGRASITMPMVFVAAGFLLGPAVTGLLPLAPEAEGVKQLTELALVLVLFADASTLRLRELRADAGLPARLLGIGLPLTVALGGALALAVAPGLGLPAAALLGAILAPTDAALGLAIFSNPLIPARVRRALNVESGLNDGIATPLVTLCIALTLAAGGAAAGGAGADPGGGWLVAALREIGLGLLIGAAAGWGGGRVLSATARRGWTVALSEQLAILGVALGAYLGALALHGNGFVAAFAGGLAFSVGARGRFDEPTEFTENAGTLASMAVWTVFGAVLVGAAVRQLGDWRPLVYAALSLTVVRMLPVAVALLGTGLRRETVALMGWFGPRGLASVVFTLLAYLSLVEAGGPADVLVVAATWTILLSVLLHGLTAQPVAAWYARRLIAAAGPDARSMPELVDVPAARIRQGHWPPAASPTEPRSLQWRGRSRRARRAKPR
jgi:NhaP-type Na+/H+ or K+/H+ antiporter